MLRFAACLLLSLAFAPTVSADPIFEVAGAGQGLPPHCDWVMVDPLVPTAGAEPACLLPSGGGGGGGSGGGCRGLLRVDHGIQTRFFELAAAVC